MSLSIEDRKVLTGLPSKAVRGRFQLPKVTYLLAPYKMPSVVFIASRVPVG